MREAVTRSRKQNSGEDNDDVHIKAGIKAVTKILVDDQAGYQKTKNFSESEKAEIVAYLMSDEAYMASATKHLGDEVNEQGSNYSGNPKDYNQIFVDAVNFYAHWPPEGKTWAKSTMKAAATAAKKNLTDNEDNGLKGGIKVITDRLVLDETGANGTQYFSEKAKAEITSHLLSDEKYMAAAKKHFSGLI